MRQTITGTCGQQITPQSLPVPIPPLPCALYVGHHGRHEAKRADGSLLAWWYGHDTTVRIS